ncbi:Holliday junction branch migration protein RuvA [uncultured Sphaerochaeta sp.]|uniref:Holliday junction branch migration protein RuvA n=1 Tax=uncultured Sphaerochaeta sp. TaxID=886478 RepID=UPI002A0A4EF2|nr:Holliday junction branch migration protein RuvA [uncultured Sphaerochaeta sp.]
MIHAVIGDIVAVTEQEVILRGGSLEYSLFITGLTASKLSQLQGSDRQQVRLLSVLQHREDSMTLFGFLDEAEREAFKQLQSVSGIGAKQALRILSGINVKQLAEALDSGNVKLLASIPGIGPKTGQKMVLALRNKLVLEEEIDASSFSAPKAGRFKVWNDILDALFEMGYDRKRSEEVLDKLITQLGPQLDSLGKHEAEELLFRNAIIALG